MRLSKRMMHQHKDGVYYMSRDTVAKHVAQLEASLGDCSICGQSPALLVDREEKGTYWLCAGCMFEKILAQMKLEAEVEKLRSPYEHKYIINCKGGRLSVEADDEEAIELYKAIFEPALAALEAGGEDVAG